MAKVVGYPPPEVIAKWSKPKPNPPYNGIVIPVVEVPFALVALGMGLIRLYSRRRFNSMGTDDWLMLAAVPFGTVMLIVTVMSSFHGAGYHIWDITHPEWTPTLQKLMLTFQMASMFVHGFLRLSLLFLYVRLFSNMKRYGFWLHLGVVYNVAVTLAGFVAFLLQCKPVQAYWDWDIHPRKCVNSIALVVSVNTLNCVGYFYVFALPLVPVPKAQLAPAKKASVMALFGILFVTCGISLTKLVVSVYLFTSGDPTWVLPPLMVLCNVEKSMTMICAAIPACVKLLRERRSERVLGRVEESSTDVTIDRIQRAETKSA